MNYVNGGPKSRIFADPKATALDGRPYIDTDPVFIWCAAVGPTGDDTKLRKIFT